MFAREGLYWMWMLREAERSSGCLGSRGWDCRMGQGTYQQEPGAQTPGQMVWNLRVSLSGGVGHRQCLLRYRTRRVLVSYSLPPRRYLRRLMTPSPTDSVRRGGRDSRNNENTPGRESRQSSKHKFLVPAQTHHYRHKSYRIRRACCRGYRFGCRERGGSPPVHQRSWPSWSICNEPGILGG